MPDLKDVQGICKVEGKPETNVLGDFNFKRSKVLSIRAYGIGMKKNSITIFIQSHVGRLPRNKQCFIVRLLSFNGKFHQKTQYWNRQSLLPLIVR